MSFQQYENLSQSQIDSGLKLIVKDGVAAEVMATLTGGAFLVALALKFGASNFQIGLLAALPTLANLFQLVSIYLLHKYANRKGITVISSVLARVPLLLIGVLPFTFPPEISLILLIGLLFIHYFFGSISGTSWSSWIKDLVPQRILGTYFSNRSRIITIVSVALSLTVASILDYVKIKAPDNVYFIYSCMFITGGCVGLYGVYLLYQVPEPKIHPIKQNLIRLFRRPLRRKNFRNLLIFNSLWAFSINLAAPFFTVYMLQTLNFPLSYIIGLSVISQISNILFIRIWGRYSDQYSNKTVLRICAPIYLFCILGWTFTTFPSIHILTIPLLIIIHIGSGIALSGVNLSLTNIGYKLAPSRQNAAVFLSTKSLITAFFAGIAPIMGGLFADFFAERALNWNLEWTGPSGGIVIHTLSLQAWDFFFFTAFILGLFSLYRLTFVTEGGEVRRKVVIKELSTELGRDVRSLSSISGLKSMLLFPLSIFGALRTKVKTMKH